MTNRDSNVGVDLAIAALYLTAAIAQSNGRINRDEATKNATAYGRLSRGSTGDNWIRPTWSSMKEDMKNCRFSIFSKYIREMKEDYEVLKERTYVERIISHLNSSEIERFYRIAARITQEQKIGCSEWFSSSEGRELRDLYLKARRLAGLV